MSQRRSGGHESAGRRALSQRRSGGVISREWAPGGAATREPAGGLGRATAGGRYLPRSAGIAAIGLWTVGYGGITSGDFLAAGQTQTDKTQEQNKNFQKRKQNEVKGRHLLLGLVFCHGAHTREEQGHADEDVNSNNNI